MGVAISPVIWGEGDERADFYEIDSITQGLECGRINGGLRPPRRKSEIYMEALYVWNVLPKVRRRCQLLKNVAHKN